MVPRHFVVRNYFVIPIHEVETAVRAELTRDRAKPRIAGKQKVRQVFKLPAVAVAPVAADVRRRIRAVRLVTSAATAMAANRLNPGRDGIGDVEHISKLAGKTVAAFAKRESAQAGAAHFLFAELREGRRVGTRH